MIRPSVVTSCQPVWDYNESLIMTFKSSYGYKYQIPKSHSHADWGNLHITRLELFVHSGRMKSCGALILSVTVSILCSSYGSPVSGGAEFDILAEVHHRVARVASLPTAGPNGTTSNPATGSTGSPVTSTSSTSSPISGPFISPACRHAYQEVLDKCITPSGLNISDFTRLATLGPTLRQLFSFLCPSSKCREAYLNYYRACIPASSPQFSVSPHAWLYVYEQEHHLSACMYYAFTFMYIASSPLWSFMHII
jgi:hypothetical protein